MKSGREGVVLDDTAHPASGSGPSNVAAVTAPEEESDDEYEQIPARKEKQRRLGSPEQGHPSAGVQPREQPLVSKAPPPLETQTPEVSADSTETQQQEEPADPHATDDDWLRSRTNRLLDLVDPEDLDSGPASNATKGSEDVEMNEADVSPAFEHAMGDAAAASTYEEASKGDALDAIRRTSRLFVRNLPYTATEDDLRETFQRFGSLQEVCHKFYYTGTRRETTAA